MSAPALAKATAVVEVLGIRHHGPGSARSVLAALDALAPDAVLIEGPADADPLIEFVAEAGMVPPVALLGYAAEDPGEAVFWPFAVFSPEWQALRWASGRGAVVRFCDLPSTAVLAERLAAKPASSAEPASVPASDPDDGAASKADGDVVAVEPAAVRGDPLAALAAAAGYDDPERWWDDVIESRPVGGKNAFAMITDAMRELRANGPAAHSGVERQWEERREAHMRQVLRQVLREGAQRVAIVCGAWHAPALTAPLPPASADAAILKGLPKRRTALSWVPWTHSRLATASGYGAGITSPGWYHHLFTAPDQPIVRWLTAVARVLREEDLPVSSAHVIEAVRLAETLGVLRGRPLAGLAEVTDATRSVLAEGDDDVLALVTERLVVGESLGTVPANAPTLPLAADLAAVARRLKLKQEALERPLQLDLRKPFDLERSRFLRRLGLLGIGWGEPTEDSVRNQGTFRETWRLRWNPELSVAVAEAAVWGTTVYAAATAKARSLVTGALPALTAMVERTLLADLPEALPALLEALGTRAAREAGVLPLLEAFPALVRARRYGDVRGTAPGALTDVIEVLLVRICAGVPAVVTGLDDDGAAEVSRLIERANSAIALLEHPDDRDRWLDALTAVVDRVDLPGLLAGRLTRLLRDAGRFDGPAAGLRLAHALSIGTKVATKASWLEGFLAGGGLLLVHDDDLLGLLDVWLRGLSPTDFVDVLPLLRRTTSTFEAGERRNIADRVRTRTAGGGITSPGASAEPAFADDPIARARAAAAVATVAMILEV